VAVDAKRVQRDVAVLSTAIMESSKHSVRDEMRSSQPGALAVDPGMSRTCARGSGNAV
jgi:hypothetical protein